MPISKLPKRRVPGEVAPYLAPPSVSAPGLLRAGSDRIFQKLVFDLFTISARIERVRVHFASKMGISGPQYSMLRAVASLQGKEGVSIGIVAEHLHVTSTFITAQSHELVRRGFLRKKEDTTDRRVSRLSLTHKGERLVDEIVEEVRPINDIFFGGLQKGEFDALSTIVEKLVESSRNAVIQISSQDQRALLSNRDKRMSDSEF
jgi:MarR family transcriptional regulator, organic hydroperoxide resistance regulator